MWYFNTSLNGKGDKYPDPKSKALFSEDNYVLLTSDGGGHWTLVPVKEPGSSLYFLDDSLGWMVTDKGIWQTEEAGRSWHKLNTPKDMKDILRVWFLDRQHGYAVGERKRVCLAGVLACDPLILALDEPFSALDVQTRAIMSTELLQLWDQTKPAVIFVTHDLEEAIALADKVVVITAGPGTVKAEFAIDLPRPRVVQEIRFDPTFTRLYGQIWEALRDEVDEAYTRTTTLSGAAS